MLEGGKSNEALKKTVLSFSEREGGKGKKEDCK